MEDTEQRQELPYSPVEGLWVLKEKMTSGSQLPLPRAPVPGVTLSGPFSHVVLLISRWIVFPVYIWGNQSSPTLSCLPKCTGETVSWCNL